MLLGYPHSLYAPFHGMILPGWLKWWQPGGDSKGTRWLENSETFPGVTVLLACVWSMSSSPPWQMHQELGGVRDHPALQGETWVHMRWDRLGAFSRHGGIPTVSWWQWGQWQETSCTQHFSGFGQIQGTSARLPCCGVFHSNHSVLDFIPV